MGQRPGWHALPTGPEQLDPAGVLRAPRGELAPSGSDLVPHPPV